MTVVLDFESSTVKSAASFYSLFPFTVSLIFQLSQLVVQTPEKGQFATPASSSTAAAG